MKAFFINQNFSRLWGANLGQILSERFRELIIPWLILNITKSPLKVGLLALMMQIGSILVSLPAGTWIEERNKVKVAIISKSIVATLIFILAFFAFQGEMSTIVFAVILFLIGMATLFGQTAKGALVPSLAGRQNLVQAHNSLEGADAISTLVGPILAGLMFNMVGAGWTLVFASALLVISLVLLSTIRLPKAESDIESSEESEAFLHKARVGLMYLISNRIQLISSITMAVLAFTTVFIALTIIIHANITLGLSATQTGILLSSAGVGNVVGVLIMGKIKHFPWVQLLTLLLLISGLGILVILFSPMWWVACIGMFIFDGALSMAFVIQGSVHQAITPDEALSRIKSASFLIGGTFSLLGTLLSGVLPEYFNSYLSLSVGIIVLLIGAFIVLFNKQLSTPVSEIEPQILS